MLSAIIFLLLNSFPSPSFHLKHTLAQSECFSISPGKNKYLSWKRSNCIGTIKLLMTDPLYNQQIGVFDGYSLSSCLHNGSQLSQTFAIHLENGQSKHLDLHQLCCILLITNCSCCISLQKYLLFSTGRMILQAQVNMQVHCASLVFSASLM